jgi:eukaryotic-like serine/threonine-protein kinase
MDELIGQVIDNYRIDEVIGRGGMGVVFKATDINLEKTVALKMIDPFLARDESFLKRFKTEAKALAKLENPNIVSVYALRETKVGVFMVMEYVKARTVSERMRENGKLSLKETLAVTKQLLNAIGHAHSVGVIHRDIKPNNILLCDNGNVKVMDFGLAKVIQDLSSQVTMTQTAAGTLYYMSPEQIKGLKNVDNRSDIYSIGMTIYEMAAGRTPFDKTRVEYEIQKQIIDGDIPSPADFNPAIPKALVKIIRKSINKDPDKRYQNIKELLDALSEITVNDEILERTVIQNKPVNTTYTKSNKRRGINIILIGAPVVLIILISLIFFLNQETVPVSDIVKENSTTKPADIQVVSNEKAYAVLTINSDPSGAEVYINGIKTGNTPFNNEIQPGTYSVSLRKPGYESYNKELQVIQGPNDFNMSLNIKAETAEAVLILNSVPSSEIFIDSKSVGSSGEIRNKLRAGSYNIKFVHPKYGTKNTAVSLKEGQSRSLICYFEQQVNIQSLNQSGEAFWGTVYINDTNTDLTTPVDLNLGPGKYRISVKKAGYKTIEDNVIIEINPEFEKKSHPLVFHFQ